MLPCPTSPILSPELPQADSRWTQELGSHAGDTIRELLADIHTKQDLQVMAASIVNALSHDLHDLRQQVDSVEEWVNDLETSANSTDSRLAALEVDQQAFRRHLIDIQLRLDDGESRNQLNNLRLRGIPKATGADLSVTVTGILNLLLGKPPTAKLELDRVHRV